MEERAWVFEPDQKAGVPSRASPGAWADRLRAIGPARLALAIVASGIVIAVTVWGWRTFWFLTDDAHIEFRYVSNLVMGRGLVWNPAPFRPVEGYTSLSWVLLLAAVWKVLGVTPPTAAPVLSLLCGFGTLALVVRLGVRWRLPPAYERVRPVLVLLALAGVLTNRTFFTWLSSGLETALFNLALIWWVCEAVEVRASKSVWRLSTAAVLCALTRPDGLLMAAGTFAIVLWLVLRARALRPALALLPLSAIGAHFALRWWTYGAWLPNTYTAKYVGPWPEAGARYLLSFIMEYGLIGWFAIAGIWLALSVWRAGRALPRRCFENAPKFVVVGVLVAHTAFYCLRIGGDHFEFRVLSHAVPLLCLSLVFLTAWIVPRPAVTLALLVPLIALTLPLQWAHWLETRDIQGRNETFKLARPIAARFPSWLGWYVDRYDADQRWLADHHVCSRLQEHKEFFLWVSGILPDRATGEKLTWDERHTFSWKSVGVLGWVLPNVAIIDELGLNDFVIARTPSNHRQEERLMAHDHEPPAGYVECFKPDLIVEKQITTVPRPTPLSDPEIVACEARFTAQVVVPLAVR